MEHQGLSEACQAFPNTKVCKSWGLREVHFEIHLEVLLWWMDRYTINVKRRAGISSRMRNSTQFPRICQRRGCNYRVFVNGSAIGPGGLDLLSELVHVETVAQFSVVFLLFAFGVEFSTTKLRLSQAELLFFAVGGRRFSGSVKSRDGWFFVTSGLK